jgi:hypothetical protein
MPNLMTTSHQMHEDMTCNISKVNWHHTWGERCFCAC